MRLHRMGLSDMNNTKECPYCGGKLEKGTLSSTWGRGIPWLPEGKQMSHFLPWDTCPPEKQGGFWIVPRYIEGLPVPGHRIVTIPADLCRQCKKVIVHLEDEL